MGLTGVMADYCFCALILIEASNTKLIINKTLNFINFCKKKLKLCYEGEVNCPKNSPFTEKLPAYSFSDTFRELFRLVIHICLLTYINT